VNVAIHCGSQFVRVNGGAETWFRTARFGEVDR
jgi:hypothetical protein